MYDFSPYYGKNFSNREKKQKGQKDVTLFETNHDLSRVKLKSCHLITLDFLVIQHISSWDDLFERFHLLKGYIVKESFEIVPYFRSFVIEFPCPSEGNISPKALVSIVFLQVWNHASI